MPQLAEKKKCTGCTACASICPRNCLTMEPDDAKKRMKLSQQGRLLMLLVFCMIGAALPCFNTVALLVPQFFPRIGVTVRGLTLKGE